MANLLENPWRERERGGGGGGGTFMSVFEALYPCLWERSMETVFHIRRVDVHKFQRILLAT